MVSIVCQSKEAELFLWFVLSALDHPPFFFLKQNEELSICDLFGQRGVSSKVSRPGSVMPAQDLAIQSQALFNIKDSNKVQ